MLASFSVVAAQQAADAAILGGAGLTVRRRYTTITP
jgi:hypothetical protein